MTNHGPLPTQTPNVHIENPKVRKAIRTTLDVIGAVAFVAAGVDLVTPAFDIAAITVPVAEGYILARVVFGFAVDNPNTPTFPTPTRHSGL